MKRLTVAVVLVLVTMIVGCAAPTPVVVEKEVVIERPVVQTVIVEKEVAIEKPVIETVIIEKEKLVVETVVVERERVVEKEVVVEKMVTPTNTPTPSPTSTPTPNATATFEARVRAAAATAAAQTPPVVEVVVVTATPVPTSEGFIKPVFLWADERLFNENIPGLGIIVHQVAGGEKECVPEGCSASAGEVQVELWAEPKFWDDYWVLDNPVAVWLEAGITVEVRFTLGRIEKGPKPRLPTPTETPVLPPTPVPPLPTPTPR